MLQVRSKDIGQYLKMLGHRDGAQISVVSKVDISRDCNLRSGMFSCKQCEDMLTLVQVVA